jgi:hypothetical protein
MEVRVRALRATLSSGAAHRIRGFIEKAPDREALAKALRDDLVKMMESEAKAVTAKDGLFVVMPYLPEGERSEVQQRVAEWAFEGLDDNSPTAKIKEQVEHRILVSQIEDLGPHGARGAALLLSRGFAVDRLFRYLVGLESPEAKKLALAAVIRLHQIPDIQVTFAHLERIAEIKTADAALYLFDIYDSQEDRDLAADAFNRALGLLEAPEVRAEQDKLVARMFKYLRGKDAEDRWFAARATLDLGGSNQLGPVLDGFADDKVYDSAESDLQKSIIDFCETGVAKLGEDPVPLLVERLTSENRVTQSISIICLKTLGANKALEPLAGVATSETSLDDLLGDKLTVGALAQNAIDGITMRKELEKKKEEGQLSDEELQKQRWHSLVILAKTGQEYKDAFDKRMEAVRAQEEAEKNPDAAPAPEAEVAPEAEQPKAPEQPEKAKNEKTAKKPKKSK